MGGPANKTWNFDYNVTRRDGDTFYEFAFPWQLINLKPTIGAGFLYGVMITDVNDIRHKARSTICASPTASAAPAATSRC